MLNEFDRYCREHCPIQYTPEWFALNDCIGGSEMGDLITNRIIELCAQKVRRLLTGTQTEYRPTIVHKRVTHDSSSTARVDPMSGMTIFDEIDNSAKATTTSAVVPVMRIDPLAGMSLDDGPMIEDTNATAIAPHPFAADIESDKSNAIMGWGTLFEPILCNYLVRRMKLQIVCRDITYVTPDAPFRYSPDGAFIDEKGEIVLLEMKNPYSYLWNTFEQDANEQYIAPHLAESHPEQIKPGYIAQVQGGMHILRKYMQLPVSYAYFAEAIYRRINRYGSPSAVNMQRMRDIRDAPAIESGIIGFYHNIKLRKVIELTRENDAILCHILSHMRAGIDGTFDPLHFDKNDQIITKVTQLPRVHDGKHLVAYLRWSMLGLHTTRVSFDPSFWSQAIVDRAQSVRDFVRKMKDRATTDEQKKELIHRIGGCQSVSDIYID
jgi:hypothetical protein